MKTIIDRATSRGYFNHGWLKTYHTFSFANYYNPRRIHFGALRVLNDDRISPGEGFDMHPHKNMEVVSIPLKRLFKTWRQYREPKYHHARRNPSNEHRKRYLSQRI